MRQIARHKKWKRDYEVSLWAVEIMKGLREFRATKTRNFKTSVRFFYDLSSIMNIRKYFYWHFMNNFFMRKTHKSSDVSERHFNNLNCTLASRKVVKDCRESARMPCFCFVLVIPPCPALRTQGKKP